MKFPNLGQKPRAASSASIAAFFWGSGLLFIIALYLVQVAIFISPVPTIDDIQTIGRISELKIAPWKDVPAVLWQQHNEHRPVLLYLIEMTYHSLFGFLNLKYLAVFGNLFLIGTFFVVLYGLTGPIRVATLPIYTITALIFFAQRFWDISMWPMASLSGFPALFFGMLTCTLLSKEKPVAAFFSAILAVLSQGNGLFALIAGGVILLRQKKYQRFFVWALLSGFVFFVYLYGFMPTLSTESNISSAESNILQSLVRFFFILWGNVLPWQAYTHTPDLTLVALIGLTIFSVLVYVLTRDKSTHSPLIGYFTFLILSVIAIANGRLHFGFESAVHIVRYTLIPITAVVAGLAFMLNRRQIGVYGRAALTTIATAFYLITGFAAHQSYLHLRLNAKNVIQCQTGSTRNLEFIPGFELNFQAMMIQAFKLGIYRLHEELPLCSSFTMVFGQRIVSPDTRSDQISTQMKGFLEHVEQHDQTLIIDGWGPTGIIFDDIMIFTPVISVFPSPTKTETILLQRHDVESIVPEEAATLTGFKITLHFQDSLQAKQASTSLCVAAKLNEHFHILDNQRPQCYSRHLM